MVVGRRWRAFPCWRCPCFAEMGLGSHYCIDCFASLIDLGALWGLFLPRSTSLSLLDDLYVWSWSNIVLLAGSSLGWSSSLAILGSLPVNSEHVH